MRGSLTPAVAEVAKNTKIPFPELTQVQLRLMPYVWSLCMDGMRLDPRKVNQEEREILSEWRHRGFLFGGASEIVSVSKDFWDTITEILWAGYADPNS